MAETQKTALAKREPTHSERFAAMVERQFAGEVGNLNLTAYDRTLAQHLFIKVDAALAEAETKRRDASKPAIAWPNINMTKLAIDAVNRVQLGIDALIPGSLYAIAYLNDRTKKYDVDLRVGYKGELFYKMNASLKPIRNVRIELVYSTDKFTIFKAGLRQPLEGYEFEITQPFERGELVGGFGYIEYEDDKDNVLVVISKAEIDKYRSKAKGDTFWGEWYAEMAYKTIVHRTMAKELDVNGRLPATFMTVAPGSWAPDVWDDILRMRTLNSKQVQNGRQMHVCPLQLDIVDRLICRYSNPGETVYDPFGGLMTVPVRAVELGRYGIGGELNADYFRDGVGYLEQADSKRGVPTLFDLIDTQACALRGGDGK